MVAVGTIDELNSLLGVVKMEILRLPLLAADGGSRATVERVQNHALPLLSELQQTLFDVGAELAAEPDAIPSSLVLIDDSDADRLVESMDDMLTQLEPLTSFILPTGSAPVAILHLARTVCRRAERDVIALRSEVGADAVRAVLLAWVNRLSDLLFVLSRWVTHQLGETEVLWRPVEERR
jgi:cob(I)alamin adenosyltransferase